MNKWLQSVVDTNGEMHLNTARDRQRFELVKSVSSATGHPKEDIVFDKNGNVVSRNWIFPTVNIYHARPKGIDTVGEKMISPRTRRRRQKAA